MSTISIVIPAFNAAEFLPRTIESVLAQTVRDWEAVVVDDGSSDGTADVARDCAGCDPRLRIIRQPNSGVAAARNRGLAEAGHGSEYIVFLDADDVWETDALASLRSGLEARPAAIAASGLSRIIDSQGRPREPGELEVWGRHRMGIAGRGLTPWPVHEPTTLAVLAFRNCIYTPGQLLIRAAALAAAGPFDPATTPCEDWDMSVRLSLQGEIAFVDAVVLNWRRHGANASSQRELMARQMLRVRQKLLSSPHLSPEQRRTVILANRLWAGHLCRSRLDQARRSLEQGGLREASVQLRCALVCYLRGARGLPAG